MARPPSELHDWPAAAAFMGPSYLRYAFTKGTRQEVAFLCAELGLDAAGPVLDVGCGPGRHAWELAARGVAVVGVDVSPAFVELAAEEESPDLPGPRPTFLVGDARRLPLRRDGFGAAICLCQGGFGLLGDDDAGVLLEITRTVRPGGLVVLSAFSSYFAVRYLEESDAFDADRGVNTEHTRIRDAAGVDETTFVMGTSCFTPRELRLLVERAGLELEHLWSVAPGAYARRRPDLDHPELLVVARIPS